MKQMTIWKASAAAAILVVLAGTAFWMSTRTHAKDAEETHAKSVADAAAKQHASLTVTVVTPLAADWPQILSANGNISAWQEAIVGSELGGLRLSEVLVNVGDSVRRGQVLARFATDSMAADLAQQDAAVETARAALFEAQSNAERARSLSNSGALSVQQTTQYVTAERSAKAALLSAEARLQSAQIRLRQTQLIAPDDGVISARSATVGMVAPQGQEMFKLIRQNRLEWRAEVTSSELLRIKPGQMVRVTGANGARADGTVRIVAPTVDQATRNALVYVDLPRQSDMHAGMFATGQFELGRAPALTVPQNALVTRDGFNYVYQVSADNKVIQTKVTLGRRVGDLVEVMAGVTSGMKLAGQGAGFLADGDTVNVVASSVASTASAHAEN